MNFEKIGTQELLSYSTILENIISSNLEIQREINSALVEKKCTKEEVEKLYNKSSDSIQEADLAYSEIQKELDLRMKRDLRLKFGIKKTQSIITEFDAFVKKKTAEDYEMLNGQTADAKRISEETLNNLKVVQDDVCE